MNVISGNPRAQTAPSNFVHPTDFGPDSALALAHAVALAEQAHARLTLLHIRGEDDAGPTRNGLAPVEQLLLRWRRIGPEERYADWRRKLGFEAACLDVPARSVAEGVLGHFEDHPVELAVLTAHSRSGLGYWFAGSVSRRALRRADTMILFLREGVRGFVDPASGEIRLRRALIAIDGRNADEIAVARARRLIDGLGGGVEKRLVHVGAVAPPGLPLDIPLTLATGPVAQAILGAAQSFRADLIVMPTAGRRGVLSQFRGSVSAEVLEEAACPVLSVPALEP